MSGRILRLVISVAVYLWDQAVSSIMTLTGSPPEGRCAVLYYHAVKDRERYLFGRQMDILLRETRPVSPDSIPHMEPGTSYTAVTFDDGFVSVKRNAIPELVRRNIPCLIFVPSATLSMAPPWLQGTKHPDHDETVISSQDVKELSNNWMVGIGSHGRTHECFLRMDEREVLEEIRKSKEELGEVTGRSVRSLSFPHGAYDARHVEVAIEAGYERLFSISPETCRGDERVIGRVRVDPEDWDVEFRMKIHGSYRWMAAASAIKRRLRGAIRGSFRHVPSVGS